jgi:hypothetical protein
MAIDVATWVAECEAVGLRTGVDDRGLVHVVIDESGWRNCRQRDEVPSIFATGSVTPTTRVCMFCRELPGRERHARSLE